MNRALLFIGLLSGLGLAALASPLGTEPWAIDTLSVGLTGVHGPGGASKAAPPSLEITSHGDPEAASTTPEAVSGTTTGAVTSVAWATAPAGGSGSCSTGAGTFSCSATQALGAAASQTLTITATGPGGTGNDTMTIVFPALDQAPGTTTPNDLPDTLTINGVAMTLVLACDGQGESSNTWSCRPSTTLTEVDSGTTAPASTTQTPAHAHDSAERGVMFTSGGDRYDPASSAVLDIATEDMVVEVVTTHPGTSSTIIDKSLASAQGWRLTTTSSNFRLTLRTGSANTTVDGPSSSAAGLAHYIVFVDRDEASVNGAIAYANGAPGTGVNVTARAGTLSNSGVASLGAVTGGTATALTMHALRIWKCPGGTPQCMAGGASNPAEWAPIARERAARSQGLRPTLAVGVVAPSALTRASIAFVDVMDGVTRAIYSAGIAGARVVRRAAGGAAVVGLLSESQTTNSALQSQTLGAAAWVPITVGDNVIADAFMGADLTMTGDNIDCTGVTACGLRQAITVVAGTTYTFSGWANLSALTGGETWVALRNNTGASEIAYFDLTACAACDIMQGDCAAALGSTPGAGVTATRATHWPIDTDGDGDVDLDLCRASITYVADTSAAHDHDLLCAEGDNNIATEADAGAEADCGWWGIEHEAFPMMTSYQATVASAVTRSADDFRFDSTSHWTGSPMTVEVQFLCPSFASAASGLLSVGSSSTNGTFLQQAVSAQLPRLIEIDTTVTQASFTPGAGDMSDGAVHTLRMSLTTNDFEGWVDGVSVGTDVSGTVNTATAIYLGSTAAVSGTQPSCVISRVRLWPRKVTPAEASRRGKRRRRQITPLRWRVAS